MSTTQEDTIKKGYKRRVGATSCRAFTVARSMYVILSISKGHGGFKKNDRVILVESRSFKLLGQKLVLVVSSSDSEKWLVQDGFGSAVCFHNCRYIGHEFVEESRMTPRFLV